MPEFLCYDITNESWGAKAAEGIETAVRAGRERRQGELIIHVVGTKSDVTLRLRSEKREGAVREDTDTHICRKQLYPSQAITPSATLMKRMWEVEDPAEPRFDESG